MEKNCCFRNGSTIFVPFCFYGRGMCNLTCRNVQHLSSLPQTKQILVKMFIQAPFECSTLQLATKKWGLQTCKSVQCIVSLSLWCLSQILFMFSHCEQILLYFQNFNQNVYCRVVVFKTTNIEWAHSVFSNETCSRNYNVKSFCRKERVVGFLFSE